MDTQRSLADVQIVNAKIVDRDYPHDFHIVRDMKKGTMRIFLLLPGIRANTVDLRIDGTSISFSAAINKLYYQLYKAKNIIVKGSIPSEVFPKVFTIGYNDGIICIDLVEKELSN